LGGTVFQGRPLDIGKLAEDMLDILRSRARRFELPAFATLRHRFEASTGIDCRAFYKNDDVQPLAAAEILERFLESGAAARFVPGKRYFFGHEVPSE
jgi:hypothetical protein